MQNKWGSAVVSLALIMSLTACSTPEEKAQKYYDKGMQLIESDPNKAKLEFQNALQMKKDMPEAIFGLALIAEKQSDWQACFGLLNKVLDLKPTHLEATVKLGQLYLAAGEVDKAKKQAEDASKIKANHLPTTMLLAAIDLKEGRFADAVTKANAVLKQDTKNADAYMILASERFSQQDIPAALTLLDKGIAVDAKNIVMYFFKISMLERTSNVAGVESTYQAMIKAIPENEEVRGKFAEFLFKQGKKSEAEAQLKWLIEHNPTSLKHKLNLVQFLIQTQSPQAGRAALEGMVKQNPDDFELGFKLADLYEIQGDTAASEAQLRSIIETAGDKPEALKAKVKVATKLLSKNKKADAQALVAEVLAADSNNVDALLMKASFAMDETQFESAILDLRTVIREQPNSAQALFLIAKAYEMTGSTGLSEESYTKAMEVSKFSPAYGVPYAQTLIRKNENDQAEKLLDTILKGSPNNIQATKLLVHVKLAKGDIEGAKAIANQIKNASNSNLSELIEAAIFMRQDNYAASIAALQKAHDKMPDDMQAILAMVKTHIVKKNFAAAESFLNNLVSKNPNNYEMKLLLAQTYGASGDAVKMHETFDSIMAAAPKNAIAYQQSATAYLRAGKVDQAKAVIEKGLLQIPNSFDLNMIMAEIHQANKAYTDALTVYETLLKTQPNSLVVINNYVSIVADYVKDEAKLQQAYTLAAKLKESSVPQFADSLGWISYRVGKYDEAVLEIKRALEKLPNYAVFHYHLGKVYLAMNNQVQAKESLETALKLSNNQAFAYSAEINELLKTM